MTEADHSFRAAVKTGLTVVAFNTAYSMLKNSETLKESTKKRLTLIAAGKEAELFIRMADKKVEVST